MSMLGLAGGLAGAGQGLIPEKPYTMNNQFAGPTSGVDMTGLSRDWKLPRPELMGGG
jgi:hypothetical protein